MLVGFGLIGLWFLFRYYNPYEHNFFPKCPIYVSTGYQCPGCGTQRALHFLTNFEISKALHENFLLIVSIPYLLFGFIVEYLPTSKFRETVRKRFYGWTAAWVAFVLIIGWWVVRNIVF